MVQSIAFSVQSQREFATTILHIWGKPLRSLGDRMSLEYPGTGIISPATQVAL
jgi:hypothetical protein